MNAEEIAAAVNAIQLALANQAQVFHLLGRGQNRDNRDIKMGENGATVEQSKVLLTALLEALQKLPV